jgi:hypothetical protein
MVGAGAGDAGAAAGFAARFFAVFLAGFFDPAFLRAGAARFAFLDFFALVFAFRFFAMVSLPMGFNFNVLPNPRPLTAALLA